MQIKYFELSSVCFKKNDHLIRVIAKTRIHTALHGNRVKTTQCKHFPSELSIDLPHFTMGLCQL